MKDGEHQSAATEFGADHIELGVHGKDPTVHENAARRHLEPQYAVGARPHQDLVVNVFSGIAE